MAQRQKEKKPQVEEDEDEEASSETEASESEERTEDALALRSSSEDALAEGAETALSNETALSDEEEEASDEAAAGQLGTERFVLAGFFASAMIGAYVLGRFIQGLWTSASNKDWFSQAVPRLAAVADNDKATLSLVFAGLVAFVVAIRTYRRPDIRTWTDEVASELSKVKWPSRKEVTSSTVIVIAASTVATLYLALLDRFWAFVTSLVYGDGS